MIGRGEDPSSLRDQIFTRVFDEHWATVRHHIEGVVPDDDEVSEIVSPGQGDQRKCDHQARAHDDVEPRADDSSRSPA